MKHNIMTQNKTKIVFIPFMLSAFFCTAFADTSRSNELIKSAPWTVTSNTYIELEEFKGEKINGDKVYDKISPTVHLSIRNPDSKWRYSFEAKRSMRNYTRGFTGRQTSFNRDRLQIQATRELYKSDKASFALAAVYRYEDNDTRAGMPARNSYDSYWLIPSGSYKLSDQLTLSFWDAFYYYDNKMTKSSTEWESEHGLEYKVNDNFTAKLMAYTDWTWDDSGNKTWEQNQIRGYFPTKINDEWNIQPYFRYYINEKTYDVAQDKVVQSAKSGGLRLGFITTFNINSKTSVWTNLAWEKTKWDKPKGLNITSGKNNSQDFRLFSLGIKHTF